MVLISLFESPEDLPTETRKEAHSTSSMPGADDPAEWGIQDVSFGSTNIDNILQGRTMEGSATTAIKNLTDRDRKANALQIPVLAGTRVKFEANLGSVLAYDDIPGDGMSGTVVTVRSADGDGTVWRNRVMVSWDDGIFRPISPEHLRAATPLTRRANKFRIRVSNFSDLADLFGPSKYSSDDLVHHATKDLWSFSQDGENYVIERLFNGDGRPLKV